MSNVTAFRSENMYSFLLKSFFPGTSSICKQALNKMLMRILQKNPHVCRKNPVLKTGSQDTVRTVDSVIYTEGYKVYRIQSMNGQKLECVRLKVKEFVHKTKEGTTIPFHEIGVFGGIAGNEDSCTTFMTCKVVGKCIVSDSYVVCLPTEALTEGSL